MPANLGLRQLFWTWKIQRDPYMNKDIGIMAGAILLLQIQGIKNLALIQLGQHCKLNRIEISFELTEITSYSINLYLLPLLNLFLLLVVSTWNCTFMVQISF